jgi:hypothetical protein
MVSDPEEANTTSPFTVALLLTSVHSDAVVLPVDLITGLNPFNLSAYGLRARWPTLRVEHCCPTPKVSLLSGWLSLPRWASLPLDFTVLPGRSKIAGLTPVGSGWFYCPDYLALSMARIR